MGYCVWQEVWLNDPDFKQWLARCSTAKHRACCIVCKTISQLSVLEYAKFENTIDTRRKTYFKNEATRCKCSQQYTGLFQRGASEITKFGL